MLMGGCGCDELADPRKLGGAPLRKWVGVLLTASQVAVPACFPRKVPSPSEARYRGGATPGRDLRAGPDRVGESRGTRAATQPSCLQRRSHGAPVVSRASVAWSRNYRRVGRGHEGRREIQETETLEVGGTDVTDRGLESLQNLRGLQTLELFGDKVTDKGLKWLKRMERLELLDLGQTLVSDAGLAELSALHDLADLRLSATRVTGLAVQRGFR